MKKKPYRILTVLLLLVLVGSAAAAGWHLLDVRQGERAYQEASQAAGLAPPELESPAVPEAPSGTDAPAEIPAGSPAEAQPEAPAETLEDRLDALAAVDLSLLRAVNPQVVGWLEIPGTRISYPLLQGEDNSYYLRHTWTGGTSSVGALFLECTNSPDFSGFNTIIYGHNMRSGAMFAGLHRYEEPGYWQEHPSVYLVDDAGLHRYDIFAAHAPGVQEIVYRLDLTEAEIQEEFITYCLERSVINTGIIPAARDSILTLSTCTGSGYDARWVVQAVLREDMVPASE